MAISFTRAPRVTTGDRITSTQFEKLALAFNDRLRSGLGDAAWRIHFWFLGLFRQVRNRDASSLLFPPQGEYFDVYQHISPQDAEWPVAGPGEPEGANVANPAMAFVFGSEGAGLLSETERFAALIWPQGEPTPRHAWLAAKQQRGAVDPDTGGMASPAFDVARAHYALAQSDQSPWGNSYGGFLPTPKLSVEGCEDPDGGDDFDPAPNYIYRFTRKLQAESGGIQEAVTYAVGDAQITYDGNTYDPGEVFTGVGGVTEFSGDGRVNQVLEYPGSCPPATINSYDDHVAYIARWPWAYYVFLNNGTVDVLVTAEWAEGPYEGQGRLRKAAGAQIQRMLWTFLREFRGSDGQRLDQSYHLQHAFDFQAFFTRQYHLAPNIGVETDDIVQDAYPLFLLEDGDPTTEGTVLRHVQSGGPFHFYRIPFVCDGAFIEATHLDGPLDIEILDNDAVVAVVTLTPDSAGNAEALWFPAEAWTPVTLAVRLRTTMAVTGSGWALRVETTELFPYRPQMHDAAMYIRAASCIASQPDGIGAHETSAEVLSDDYQQFGCIINRAGLPGIEGRFASVNPNAIYDAIRRASKLVRAPRRQELVAYAVESGKSILWFRRHSYGLDGTVNADVWEGIAPGRERLVSGDIREGYLYEVRVGTIVYNQHTYSDGQRFTGTENGGWEGGGEVYEAGGIRATAPPHDYSNEWLLGVDFIAYHPSNSSLWKADSYSDYFHHLVNRCHFYSPDVANDSPSRLHFAFGQAVGLQGILAAEAPPGYNYVSLAFPYVGSGHANQIDCGGDPACEEYRRQFYRSCRVYEPDIAVESCETEIAGDGTELVKVTLTGRLHHHSALAPSAIDRDIATWDLGDLTTEATERRTIENGIREYLVYQSTGLQCDHTGAGNSGVNSGVYALPDNPFGSCYPKFRLTKLIPVPFEDGNDAQQRHDTRFEHDAFAQMELYLRCMCEGFVDGETTLDQACKLGATNLYDFSFAALCLQAFGDSSVGAFTAEDRDDAPECFGPIPNTVARAAVFNRLAAAVDLLDTVRVMLPAVVQCHSPTAISTVGVQVLYGDATPATCSGPTAGEAVYVDRDPEYPAPAFGAASWADCTGATISIAARLTGACDGALHAYEVSHQGVMFRWALVDPDAEEALPEAWRDMLDTNASVFCVITKFLGSIPARGYTTDPGEAETCASTRFPLGDGRYLTFPQVESVEVECRRVSGEYTLPALARSTVWRAYDTGGGGTECVGGPETRHELALVSADTPTVTVPLEG